MARHSAACEYLETARLLLLLTYDQGVLDDEDLLLLTYDQGVNDDEDLLVDL